MCLAELQNTESILTLAGTNIINTFLKNYFIYELKIICYLNCQVIVLLYILQQYMTAHTVPLGERVFLGDAVYLVGQ